MKRCLITLLAAVAFALSQPARAQSDAVASAVAPFDDLVLAARLARWGAAHDDPFALATAARLRQATDRVMVERGGSGASEADDPVERWLSAAEALAGGDPRVAALVAEIRATGFKGRSGGPRVSLGRVRGGTSNRYVEPFDPARTAVVYLEGDGDTDLRLIVREADGRVVCTEDDPGDIKMCVWTPGRSGGHTVEISNGGVVDNAYSLATN